MKKAIDPADYRLIGHGDVPRIETGELREGKTYPVRNLTAGIEIPATLPLSQAELGILKADGRPNWIRARKC